MHRIVLAIIILVSISFAEKDTTEWLYKTVNEDSFKLPVYQNYTIAERTGAILLNIIPGLGSYLIMDDTLGAITHLLLSGTGIAFFTYDRITCGTGLSCLNGPTALGIILFGFGSYWGGFRPLLVNKPVKQITSRQTDGFNMAILPNRQGNLTTYLLYNRNF